VQDNLEVQLVMRTRGWIAVRPYRCTKGHRQGCTIV